MAEQTQPGRRNHYQPIEDYGVIGNLHTVALVSLRGSIDFMSFMRFDSPTIFCKMLDAGKGGSFSVTPQMEDMITKQLYLPDTNVLVTRFFANEGIAEIIDYMPLSEEEYYCAVVRKITMVRGNGHFRVVCDPHFNYAQAGHSLRQEEGGFLFVPDAGNQTSLLLLSDQPLQQEDSSVTSLFRLKEGETAFFILEDANNRNNRQGSLHEYVEGTYRETIRFWQCWVSQSNYTGPWQEVVRRSALTLKLLISHRYGSMVAAPTFSLPEAIGYSRNWDYRYTWIRDAAFSMHAFLELGFMEEAEAFLDWVRKQSAANQLQLMFAIDGGTEINEQELTHLEGYKNSGPVRIGNDAYKQTQLDIYGELLETVYIYTSHGGDITYDFWKVIKGYTEYVINNWQQPDHSIWEVRGGKKEFLFSRMMCWVAIDRAIKIGDQFSFPFDILKWHNVRNQIYEDLHENFWNSDIEAFVQYKGAAGLDASVLLMPILNVVSPFSDKWQKTMLAIDEQLRSDVLIYRYREQQEDVDGIKGHEGTFTMCSFWYVECLAMSGQHDKAKEYFEKVLGYANHLGLYSEQLGMKGEHLGNFPQAFTHLALISAAIELNKPMRYGISQQPVVRKKTK